MALLALRRWFFSGASCLFSLPLVAAYGQGQPAKTNTAPISTDTEKDVRFVEELDAFITAHPSAVIIAESYPLQRSGRGKSRPLNDLNALAESYDYQALPQLATNSTYVLRKRYTNPRDLPAVTLDEMRLSFADLDALLSPLSPNVRAPTDIVVPFYASLTKAQFQELAGPDGLSFSKCTYIQRQLIERMARDFYMGDAAGTVASANIVMQQAIKTTFTASLSKPVIPGIYEQLPVGTLTLRDELGRDYAYSLPTATPSININGQMVSNDEDKKAWVIRDRFRAAWRQGQTIGSVVSALNASAAQPASVKNKLVYRVAPELADKPLTLAGPWRTASPDQIVESIARLYGLRLRREAGVAELRRAPRPRTMSMTDLPRVARGLLPLPFRRALRIDVLDTPPSESKILMDADKPDVIGHKKTLSERGTALSWDAAKWLAFLRSNETNLRDPLHPLPDARIAVTPVPVADLDPITKTSIGIAIGSTAISNTIMLFEVRSQPYWFAHLESLYLRGGEPYLKKNNDRPRASLFLNYRDPITGQEDEAGALLGVPLQDKKSSSSPFPSAASPVTSR